MRPLKKARQKENPTDIVATTDYCTVPWDTNEESDGCRAPPPPAHDQGGLRERAADLSTRIRDDITHENARSGRERDSCR